MPTEDVPEKVPEVWAYMGIRAWGGKKSHLWRDAEGTERSFGKLSAYAVGGMYDVNVVHKEEGVSVFPPKYTGDTHPDTALVNQWQTEHRLAEVELARLSAERKIKASADAFDKAMDRLVTLRSASCRTRHDRVAFSAMVMDYLGTH